MALENNDKTEGELAKAIENQTAKLPSDVFLWSALGVLAASACLHMSGKKHSALFVGQLAAPLLICGVYDKLVKLEGHDQQDRG
jgi:hypothetical protein